MGSGKGKAKRVNSVNNKPLNRNGFVAGDFTALITKLNDTAAIYEITSPNNPVAINGKIHLDERISNEWSPSSALLTTYSDDEHEVSFDVDITSLLKQVRRMYANDLNSSGDIALNNNNGCLIWTTLGYGGTDDATALMYAPERKKFSKDNTKLLSLSFDDLNDLNKSIFSLADNAATIPLLKLSQEALKKSVSKDVSF